MANKHRSNLPAELIYQVGALLVAVIVVHLLYVTMIRPNANALLADQAERSAAGESFVPERSLYVVLRDYEQESCFILMLWSIAIMGYKGRNALRERALLQEDVVEVAEGMSVLPEDAREYTRPIQALSSSLHCLGYSKHRLYRYCARNWRCTRPGLQSSRGRHCRCNSQPGRRV